MPPPIGRVSASDSSSTVTTASAGTSSTTATATTTTTNGDLAFLADEAVLKAINDSDGAATATTGDIDRDKHPSGIVPTLQNVVSSVALGCELDLKKIALQVRNTEYNPKRFSGVIVRLRDPKTTAMLFASGKMMCTGARSEDDSKIAARKFAYMVKKLGFAARFVDFKVHNIVASTDVRFAIRLESLASEHAMFSSYEPELFSGLVYRMLQPKVVLLVFVSGKVVLTGAKTRDDVYTAFEKIYPLLQRHRKQ